MQHSSSISDDPIGLAIQDYLLKNNPQDIVVSSDRLEDDVIPVDYLFRTYKKFPTLEKKAMQLCKGTVLDIGAAAGCHTNHLLKMGFDVSTLEISSIAHQNLLKNYPKAEHYFGEIQAFKQKKFDTLLLLMNGIGIAGTHNKIVSFLTHLSKLLNPGGQILCDSTNVSYLYDNVLPPTSQDEYYGNFKFKMSYKNSESQWFDWVYIDLENFKKYAEFAGFTLNLCAEDETAYLVQLIKKI